MEYVFLAFEVEIHGAVGNTGLAGNVCDFRVEVAVAREDSYGGAQNRFALIASGRAVTIE